MNRPNRSSSLTLAASLIIAGSLSVLSACTTTTTTQAPTPAPTAASPVATTTTAQDGGASPLNAGLEGANRAGTDPIELIQNPQIKKELNITEDQISKLQQLESDFRKEMQTSFAGMTIEKLKGLDEAQKKELEEKVRKQVGEARDQVGTILKPEQLERFKQINLQIYGFGVLSFDHFSKDLKLTEAQEKELRELQRTTFQKIRANLDVPEEGKADAETLKQIVAQNRKRTEEIFKGSNEKALAVLTADQKQLLEKLKGNKFELDPAQLPSPSPG